MCPLSLVRCTLVPLVLVVVAAAQHDEPRLLDLRAPAGDAVVDPEGTTERWLNCRIVDAITGEPLPDAEVLLMAEQNTPIAGEFAPAMRLEADDEGFVSARIDEGVAGYRPWNWLCVRAPGYGQYMQMGVLDPEIVRLAPAIPVPVQVRDWADRPVENALVGFCAGCGHTQDLVHGRTGADGVLTMTGIDLWNGIADFYVVHRDLALGYDSPEWFPGAQPMVLRVGAGVPHEGMLVGADGQPVAGATVGISGVHRGPWARTAADGTFRLYGLESRSDLWVHVDGWRLLFEEDGVQHMRLKLPPTPDRLPDDDRAEVLELTDDRREARDRQREHERELQERREQAWPRVPVRVVGLPQDGGVTLRTRRQSWDLDDAIEVGEPVALPDEPFVFELATEGRSRVVAVDRSDALADGVVRLHWYRPTMVEGRILNSAGWPAPVRVAVTRPGSTAPERGAGWHASKGALSLPTAECGTRWLVIEEQMTDVRVILTIELPERGDDACFDIGTITMPEEPAHRFERPDGTPLVDGSVRLLRAGWTDLDRGWAFEAGPDGNFWLPELLPGDALLVRSRLPEAADLDGAGVVDLPTRFVIGHDAPVVFRMHGGELRFDVDTGGGTAYATLGDRVAPLRGATVVRGLQVGRHDVFLAAYGRRSAALTVDVVAGERRRVRAVLPKR
ncbi:MAG: hypothetical protein ACE37K_19135 [Planctomycetota bacterium]